MAGNSTLPGVAPNTAPQVGALGVAAQRGDQFALARAFVGRHVHLHVDRPGHAVTLDLAQVVVDAVVAGELRRLVRATAG